MPHVESSNPYLNSAFITEKSKEMKEQTSSGRKRGAQKVGEVRPSDHVHDEDIVK